MKVIRNHTGVHVFYGVDAGNGEHHAVALDGDGQKPKEKAMSVDEANLREVVDNIAVHETLLFVVDQLDTIGDLPVAVV